MGGSHTIRALAAVLVFVGAAHAQRGAAPPLLECGAHGGLEVICGTFAPEDLEPAPDGRRLFVSQFGRGGAAGLSLFDPAAGTFAPLSIRMEPRPGWGETACAAPAADLGPHGISLGRRPDGATALYVVNHGGRESIEMYEVLPAAQSWELAWRGCVLAAADYNDVAILPDGGFVGTLPTAFQAAGELNVAGGLASGYVGRWTPAGETLLPGTETGYPNGVAADAGGRYIYFAAFTGRELRKYDLEAQAPVGLIELDFMPDNLSWTPEGRLLAAGIKGVSGNCPAGGGVPCIQGFKVAEIDPEAMEIVRLFESAPGPSPISGVSIALKLDGVVYLGAFQGDRLVRIPWTD